MKHVIRIILLSLAISTLFSGVAFAEQKYNPHTHQWETVPDSSWMIRYNPHTNKYSYQPKDAKVQYNRYSNAYEWSSGHGNG